MKPKLLNAEPDGFSTEARRILDGVAEVTEARLDRAGLLREIAGFEILLVRLGHQIDAEVFAAARRLNTVACAATGTDHIDMDAAAVAGVTVLTLKGETEFLESVSSTAEHAWGLLLTLARRTVAAHADVLSGKWRRDSFRGFELKGKTLGIVGYGRLGRKVADYGKAFGMTVLACDPRVDPASRPEATFVSLQELLSRSDAVSLHVPLDETTRGLLGRPLIDSMKRGAVLVNTSRGGVLDETALLDALRSGALAGAALDVLRGEERTRLGDPAWPASEPLSIFAREGGNVILTPHLGGATGDGLAAAEVFMAEKIAKHVKGETA